MRFHRLRTGGFLPLIIFTLTSCSVLWETSGDKSPLSPTSQEKIVVSGPEGLAAPFSLEVLREEFDGHHLALLAVVTAHKHVEQNDPLVRVTPYRQGHPLPTSTFRVADYAGVSETGSAGTVLKLPLVVPADGMTDYQIELLWGKEADVALSEQARREANLHGFSGIPGVEVSNVQMLENGALYALLSNRSPQVLSGVGIEVAFAQSGGGLDFQKAFQENGVLVELRDLNLEPNGEKKLKILLDGPSSPGAALSPLIRVVPLQSEAIEIYE